MWCGPGIHSVGYSSKLHRAKIEQVSKQSTAMAEKQTLQNIDSATPIRGRWLAPLALFALIILLAWAPVGAAPSNQTVPIPTNEPTSTSVPTATPSNDDDDDGSGSDEPTAEPEETPDSPPEEPVDESGPTGSVTVSVLNVRSGPDVSFEIQGTVFGGDILDILGRTEDDSWWQICCAFGQDEPGWVDSQLIAPNFDLADSRELLPVIRVADDSEATPGTSAMAAGAEGLLLEIRQTPAFVWQGKSFNFQFVVTNSTGSTATVVELRDDLPSDLIFVSANASGGGEVTSLDNEQGGKLLTVLWPQLAPDEEVTVTVSLQIPPDLAAGYVINNLAVAGAQNAKPTTAGLAIGMPPTTLPSFK